MTLRQMVPGQYALVLHQTSHIMFELALVNKGIFVNVLHPKWSTGSADRILIGLAQHPWQIHGHTEICMLHEEKKYSKGTFPLVAVCISFAPLTLTNHITLNETLSADR